MPTGLLLVLLVALVSAVYGIWKSNFVALGLAVVLVVVTLLLQGRL